MVYPGANEFKSFIKIESFWALFDLLWTNIPITMLKMTMDKNPKLIYILEFINFISQPYNPNEH